MVKQTTTLVDLSGANGLAETQNNCNKTQREDTPNYRFELFLTLLLHRSKDIQSLFHLKTNMEA
jgi:hypothetical protein